MKWHMDGTTPDGYKVNANGAWVDANGKEYDAPGGEQKTSGKRSGGSDGSSDSDSGSSSGGNSSNSGNTGNNGSSSENGGSTDIGGDNSGNNGSTDNSGNNSGNNGNAGDSGNNSGNNENTGDNGNNSGSNEKPGDSGNDSGNEETPETKTLVVESQTKLVDLGWSQYVTVAFAKGYSLDDCTLTVDGTDVTSAFTKVDRDGTIAKWEITNLNPAVLAVTGKDGETQIIRLSENENPEAPEVREIQHRLPFWHMDLYMCGIIILITMMRTEISDGNRRQRPLISERKRAGSVTMHRQQS